MPYLPLYARLVPPVLLLPILTPFATLAVAQKHTQVGGYGEVQYRNATGRASPGQVSVPRFVVYLAHSFGDRLSFRSELELEDARVEGGEPGGEVSLEQAYLDYRFGGSTVLRTGLLLIPLGIVNETHEPPTFNGVARPEFDRVILPTTWRDIGIGLAGPVPGLTGFLYRAYVVNGLNASGFDAEAGIRGGRQEGGEASFRNPAVVARVEYARPGLKLGAAVYHGGSANDAPGLGTSLFASPVTILAGDLRYTLRGWAFRAEAADIHLGEAGRINQAFGGEVGSRMAGWYGEVAYDLLRLVARSSSSTLQGFARYERLNTQAAVPPDLTRDDALARRLTTVGLTFKPVPNVAFKGDFQLRRNRAQAGEDEVLSLGIGWQF